METESFGNEQSPNPLSNREEVAMEEERSGSEGIVIDVFLKDNMYGLVNRRRSDSLQVESGKFEPLLSCINIFTEERPELVQSIGHQTNMEFSPDAIVSDVPCLPTCTNLRDPDLWTISSQTVNQL